MYLVQAEWQKVNFSCIIPPAQYLLNYVIGLLILCLEWTTQ